MSAHCSPSYPGSQSQLKLPILLRQIEFFGHEPLASHSSISKHSFSTLSNPSPHPQMKLPSVFWQRKLPQYWIFELHSSTSVHLYNQSRYPPPQPNSLQRILHHSKKNFLWLINYDFKLMRHLGVSSPNPVLQNALLFVGIYHCSQARNIIRQHIPMAPSPIRFSRTFFLTRYSFNCSWLPLARSFSASRFFYFRLLIKPIQQWYTTLQPDKLFQRLQLFLQPFFTVIFSDLYPGFCSFYHRNRQSRSPNC